MALELKKRSKEYLNKVTNVTDVSTDIGIRLFGITSFPEYLGEGKNSFKIKPTRLQNGSPIQIEIIDVNGNPIYWETTDYKDSDKSSLISIWVYNLPSNNRYDTPDGRAELSIIGTGVDGKAVRWKQIINVVKSKQSPSKIIFKQSQTPSMIVSSSVDVFTNIPQSNGILTPTIVSTPLTYKKSLYGNSTSFESTTPIFNQEMVGGELNLDMGAVVLFPRLTGGQLQPASLTSSITSVVSSTILQVESPITTSDVRRDGSIHTYEYSDGTIPTEIKYYSTASNSTTQNQIAFANITVSQLSPIAGRIFAIRTSIKSQGLPASNYETIAETTIDNTSSVFYKVPVPTEQLKDPKTLRLQFVNQIGDVSTVEIIKSNVVFEGGNVYIGGDQSLITGSFNIGNAIGTGIEMAGNSSGYLKSVGYDGFTNALNGSGPGGFLLFSGSGNLNVGSDTYDGVGLDLVANSSSYFRYTTNGGGNLDIRTDSFFIGNPNTQFISGAASNIEISSSFFHLNPKDNEAIIGGFVVTPTSISSSLVITGLGTPLALKANGDMTGSNVLIRQRVGTTNYTLLDTRLGLIDARNVGRQIVSDSTEYVRQNVDDNATYTIVSEYPVTFLPYETKLGISFSLKGISANNTDSRVSSLVQFYIAGALTGSNAYDLFDTPEEIGIVYSRTTPTTQLTSSFVYSPEDSSYIASIPDELQGRFCKIQVGLANNHIAGAGPTGTSTRIKNISIISTRVFAGDFSSKSAPFDPGQAEQPT